MSDLKLSLLIRAVDKGATKLVKTLKGGLGGLTGANKKLAGAQKSVTQATTDSNRVTAQAIREAGGFAAWQAKLIAEAKGAKGAIDAESRAVDNLGRRTEALGRRGRRGFGIYGRAMTRLIRFAAGYQLIMGAINLAGKVAALPVTGPIALFKFGLGQASQAKLLEQQAHVAGVTVERLQELREAYRQNELEADRAADLYKNLSKAQGDALKPKSQQLQAFRSIGVSIRDRKGKLKDLSQLLRETADGYAKIQHVAKRQKVAELLFGAQADEADAVLGKGAKGLDEYALAARRNGLYTRQQIEDAKAARRAWLDLTGSLEGLVRVAGGAVFPILTRSSNALTAWFRNDANRKTIVDAIAKGADAFSRSLPKLLPQLTQLLDASLKLVTEVDWPKVATGLVAIAGAVTKVVEALEAFNRVGGWGAMERAAPFFHPPGVGGFNPYEAGAKAGQKLGQVIVELRGDHRNARVTTRSGDAEMKVMRGWQGLVNP